MALKVDWGEHPTSVFVWEDLSVAVPRISSVTPREEYVILEALQSWDKRPESGVGAVVKIAHLAILRAYPDQFEADTDELPLALLRQLCDFMLSERREWEEDEDGKKSSTSPDMLPTYEPTLSDADGG